MSADFQQGNAPLTAEQAAEDNRTPLDVANELRERYGNAADNAEEAAGIAAFLTELYARKEERAADVLAIFLPEAPQDRVALLTAIAPDAPWPVAAWAQRQVNPQDMADTLRQLEDPDQRAAVLEAMDDHTEVLGRLREGDAGKADEAERALQDREERQDLGGRGLG
jgi:hypothetical protein